MESKMEGETTKLKQTTAVEYPYVAKEIRSSGGVIISTTATDGVLTVEYK